MSKNPKVLGFCILIESSICNLSHFFDMIKNKSQEKISSDHIFNVIFNEKTKRQTITGDKNVVEVELFGITE